MKWEAVRIRKVYKSASRCTVAKIGNPWGKGREKEKQSLYTVGVY